MPASSTSNTAPVEFSAPWSRQLALITLLCGVIMFGISGALLAKAPEQPPLMYQVGIGLSPAIFLLCALCAVRGYRLQGSDLFVVRPGWRTRVSLAAMESVSHDPEATSGSIRIFGNGGLFGFIGLFRNQKLGRYRAFATDLARTVVIRLPAQTIVVTPNDPKRFVEALQNSQQPVDRA
ncbi:PH domain-containing protein [Microbulbifer hydrolyticus]|uniref:Bacterial Pleckstrin homology domain-containing protein n=1 Tax=Microbulbifer hydrolyticus TaxID=48074 RepID=A0A6P1TCD0_9GAMM|nr:PH domain-containing protein [Microbulbifer hydrolyticus]MBB5210014.1 hypothetical protein [Microbulbifer hydrolyticus]QHQ39461.1 hypothetical protein GTQ55_11025 [Microbulbifer hydrolyticus]